MQSLTLRSHSGKNGILTLEVPVAIADADWEVVVVVQPATSSEAEKTPEKLGWPAGFFEQTFGCLPDLPQPVAPSEVVQTPEELGWPAGFFETVIGGWQGESLVREEQAS